MSIESLQKRGPLRFPPGVLLIFALLPLLTFAWLTPADEGISGSELEAYPWVYLRQGRPLAPGERVASVLAVGDVMPGRDVPAGSSVWNDAAGWLSAAHLTIGNLEAVLVDGGTPRQAPTGEAQPILLRASPAAAESLKQAGFDILGLANNHSLDYGTDGLKETMATLQRAGVETIGLMAEDGGSRGHAGAPSLFRSVDGVRLAFLAFNAVPDPHPSGACLPETSCRPRPSRWNPVETAAAIESAKAGADAVIVSMHWGFEYETQVDPFQEEAARIMLEAGADLIVGHHPHVAQAVAVNGNRVTAYSLGNFVFDQGAEETTQGLALHAFFDKDGLRAAQLLPIWAGIRPRLQTAAEGASLLARVLPPPPRVGFACDESGCTPVEVPQTDSSGRYYGGQIDLTGDGSPETVRREGEGVTIYEKGSAAWRSPVGWRVVDAALGDPNDDGRFEVMLAIWQKDGAGYERSQPYIVGYRGGSYGLLWGGRPVADPIRELAVGDVDGDGTDELIVIEEMSDGSAQAVSAWRWTGWTFSLVWRSPYGWYRDLILVEGDQTLISAVLVNK